jgi:hypothetical protein
LIKHVPLPQQRESSVMLFSKSIDYQQACNWRQGKAARAILAR